MSSLNLKFLGTAAAEGWPGVFCMCDSCKNAQLLGGKNWRLRSSVLINDDMLVDLSPDFVNYKMKYAIDSTKLKYLLITHTHLDHFYPQLLGYNYKSFSTTPISPLNIYCSSFTKNMLETTLYENKDALSNVVIHEVKPFETYTVGEYEITPLPATHSAPESLLYIIKKGNDILFYGNDTYLLKPETYEYLKNYKLTIVSLDATMGLKTEGYFRHLSFYDIVNLKKQLICDGIADEKTKFIATHFSHFVNMTHSKIEEFFNPHSILTAYDGMDL